MKNCTLILSVLLLTTTSLGQSTTMFSGAEYCKKEEIRIITGDRISDNYIVVGISQLDRINGLDSIENLSRKT